MYRIALNFEDGATRFIDCNAGEKVLDAAFRNKVNLPMDCSDGVCGTCKCRCEQGTYDQGEDYIADALSADEEAERLVLTCQMVPLSDCVIAVPVASTALKLKPAEHHTQISSVELVSNSTIILSLTLGNPAALHFLAGQYVNLEVPGTGELRAYSFSSKPGDSEASFLIRNVPSGRMSDWLTHHAAPGAPLKFFGPYGSFYLRPVERPLLMLAGGTGLAPLLSMLEVLADTGSAQPVHLLYGVTRDDDLVELPRLEALAARLPQLTWSCCVADPASTQPRKGFVTDHLAGTPIEAGDCDVYLCGPPPMVEAVRQTFANRGFTPARFLYEKFAVSVAA